MTLLRKHTAAWLLVLTALAGSSVGGGFIYLREEIQTDPAYIETHLSEVANSMRVDLDAARKDGYSDDDIAAGIVKSNRAEFNQQWYRILLVVGVLYFVSVVGILAVMFRREAVS